MIGPGVDIKLALGFVFTLGLTACDRGTPIDWGAAGAGRSQTTAEAKEAAGGGTGVPSRVPTQVAARVNGQEVTIHQVQERLPAVGGGSPGSPSAAAPRQQALEQLIDLTLIGQEAAALGLEKDPAVMRQLQAARQEVLARAWAQQMVEDEPGVSAAEIRRYYDEHPAWFAQRRVFHLQELRCEATGEANVEAQGEAQGDPARESHRTRLLQARQPEQAQVALEKSGMRCRLMALNLGGEQLSPPALERLQGLRRGDSMAAPGGSGGSGGSGGPGGSGLRHWWLQTAVEQPITWVQAQPAIERALLAQRHAQRARREIQRLREAARIETFGEFSTPDGPRGESLVRP